MIDNNIRQERDNRVLHRLFAAIILASVISACGWPSVSENTDGLGDGAIGNYLREAGHRNHSEVELRREIAELIFRQFSTKSVSRLQAESLGARCEKPPSTECNYLGEMSYRLSGLPRGSHHEGKRTVVSFKVRFSYLKP